MLNTSVKQLRMAHGCPRQWVGHYILKEPIHDAPGEGIDVHDTINRMLTGQHVDFGPETRVGKMARVLVQNVQLSLGWQTEVDERIYLPRLDMTVGLRCDLLLPSERAFVDWKTTGAERENSKLKNGKLWAQPNLLHDWEARTYAHLLMEDLDWPTVRADWRYVSKKFEEGRTPRTWLVSQQFERYETREWFEKYATPARDLILELREAYEKGDLTNFRDAPHNAEHCEHSSMFCDFGGKCGFISSPIVSYGELHLPVIQ